MESIEDSRQTGHLKVFLPNEKQLISTLVNKIDEQAQILFGYHQESLHKYTLGTNAFLSMYIDLGSCEEIRPYLPKKDRNISVDLSLATNITSMREFHNPCFDFIHSIPKLREQIPDKWMSDLYHIYKDPHFKVTRQKIIFDKPHGFYRYKEDGQEKIDRYPIRKKLYLHYIIGKWDFDTDFFKHHLYSIPLLQIHENPPQGLPQRQRYW